MLYFEQTLVTYLNKTIKDIVCKILTIFHSPPVGYKSQSCCLDLNLLDLGIISHFIQASLC